VPELVKEYLTGHLKVDEFVTHMMPLNKINDAFDLMHHGQRSAFATVATVVITSLQQQQQHPFNIPLSGTTWVSWYQKGKINLDLLEQEIVSGSGISWDLCKSAPRSRQITMPAPHHSVFYRPGALPATQPTVLEH